MPIAADDFIVVANGTLVVVNLLTQHEYVLGAGSRFVMPRSVDAKRPSWWQRATEAVGTVASLHLQKTIGAVRSTPRMWPDNARFSPQAHIEFRWDPTPDVAALRLRGSQSRGGGSQVISNPSPPTAWPANLARVPGQYSWEIVRAGGDKPLATATFEILSNDEAAARAAVVRARAAEMFPVAIVEIATELLAAEENLVLK